MSIEYIDTDGVIAAEQEVLGSVFYDNEMMDKLAPILVAEDFSVTSFQLVWKSMKHLYDRNQPIDHITVGSIFERAHKLEEVGGFSFLISLKSSGFTTQNALYHARYIKRNSLKRKGIELANNIRAVTMEDDFETTEEYLSLLDALYTNMRPDTTGKMRNFNETEEEYMKFLVTKDENILTGFNRFDEWSGGIGRGWLYIIAGRPSIGKTAKAMQMAGNISEMGVGEILVWSQEMSFNQLKNRILSNKTGVNFAAIRKKNLDQREIDRIQKAHREIGEFPFYVEDSTGVTIEHITATARQVKRQKGQIGAIFVDYLTRMDIKQEKGQSWSRAVGEVAKRFKWLAQELQCPVFLLAQLNREGANTEPQLDHLRDSGEIEQEADVVEFLWEDTDDTSRDGKVVQSSIAKGRDIGTSKFKYLFKGWIQRYEDYP